MQTELTIRKRVVSMLLIFLLLFTFLVLRITNLTTFQSAELTQRGIRQWTREGTVYARRGNILDTTGQTLVVSATAYIISADPRKIKDPQAFASCVCPVLDLAEEEVIQKVSDKSKAAITLKRQVSREIADLLRQLENHSDPTYQAVGNALLYDEDVRRAYPRGAFLVQTLGLTNIDGVGQSGMEKQYEKLLQGTQGVSLRSVDMASDPSYDQGDLYVQPQDGNSIKLTTDAVIQSIVEKAMRECYDVNKAQAVHTLVMDVYTGEILAMCSKPDYDPNDPPRDQPDALQSLMRIKLISDAYEPGSTFKILTAAAALDAGVTTPEESFYCSGKITVDGDTIHCWGNPHEGETMAEALQNSCNPVFVELALRLGTERMYQYLKTFGLGSLTHVDLPGESGGIMIPMSSVKNVDLARIGFGQSVAVTPIQLLTAACSVVNGGKLMKPYLLKEVISPEGQMIYRAAQKVVATPISEETSQTMRELLELVVSIGGAKNAQVDGYRIGGKTGTAQVYKDGKIVTDVHIGSFLGFAPANDPKIALLVIVDEADMPVDYGGTTAAPYARQILADVLPYLGYQPMDDDQRPEIAVSNVVGMPLWEARATIAEQGFSVIDDGVGDVVTAQMPSGGGKLIQGGQVMLYTYEDMLPEVQSLVCVPNVKDMTIAQATVACREQGLRMDMVGSGYATMQTPVAGAFVAPDTVVEVVFEMPNP